MKNTLKNIGRTEVFMKLFFALCICLNASLALAQTITPGMWKASTVVKLNSLALPPVDVNDCISANEAKDIQKYIQENLMPETQCKIKTWDYKKPDIKISLSCENEQYSSKGDLAGKVTEKAFNIAGTMKGSHVMMGSVDVGIDYKGTFASKTCK